jgi:hypothetical protein
VIEALLDRSSALHWAVVGVLAISGAPCAWIGIRGLARRELTTNGGHLTGGRAIAAGAVYLAFGAAGIAGAIAFVVGGG